MRLEGAKGQGDANLVPDHLGAISGRRGTDRWVVLVWLGAFVLLTAGVGLGMKLIRYGERTWLFMLPVALLMSLAAYIYAESRKADPSLSYVGMALANGDKRAIVYQATGYYSPNEYVTTAYSGSPQGWLLPLVRKANPLEKTELRRAQGVIWPDMTVQRDSAKTFLAAAAIDFDGLDFWAAFGPAGLTGTVVNRTGQDMSDAVLFIHNRAFKIGLVPAEKPTEVKIGPEDRLDEHSFVPAGFKKAEDRWRGELIAGLVEYKSQSSSSLYDDEPYLLGWVDRPVLSPGSDLVAAPCKGLMLVAQRVAFSPTPAGTTVLIPDPMLVKDFKAQALWSRKTGFTRSQYAATVDSLVAPPASVGRLTSTRATMQIALHALGWRLNILGVRPDGSTQPLESFDNPTGPKTIQIEQADNFTADGVLRIRAAVESLNGPAKPAAAAAVNQWKIDFIEFTLQGIVQ
jgi:hypothetical protein